MALEITPGPLPADGTRINVQTVLSAFVKGTYIGGFDYENFGGPLSFVKSSTEAPATEYRTAATLWFERGTGRTLQWRTDVCESGVTALSEVAAGYWKCISDTRDVGARVRAPAATHQVGEFMHCIMHYSDHKAVLNKYGGAILYITGTQYSLAPNNKYMCDPFLVAVTETIAPSQPMSYHGAFKEWGFCEAFVVGNGPALYVSSIIADISEYGHNTAFATSVSLAGQLVAEIGLLAQSDTETARRKTKIFKYPSMTNILHGSV